MQILANIFVVMPLESSHYSVAGISKLPLWIETDLSPTSKHWYDECFFLKMKPEYSVMQNSAIQMGNSGPVIEEKIFISTVNLRCFELWMDQGILFEITQGFTKTYLIKLGRKYLKNVFFLSIEHFFQKIYVLCTLSSTVIVLGVSVYGFHTTVMPKFVTIALICNNCSNS